MVVPGAWPGPGDAAAVAIPCSHPKEARLSATREGLHAAFVPWEAGGLPAPHLSAGFSESMLPAMK